MFKCGVNNLSEVQCTRYVSTNSTYLSGWQRLSSTFSVVSSTMIMITIILHDFVDDYNFNMMMMMVVVMLVMMVMTMMILLRTICIMVISSIMKMVKV